jgi:hypothetical protein
VFCLASGCTHQGGIVVKLGFNVPLSSLIKDFEREARADGMSANELAARKRLMAAELNGFIEMKKQFAQSEGTKSDLLNGAQGGEIEMGTDGECRGGAFHRWPSY